MSTCMDACQCNYPPEILGQGDVWENPRVKVGTLFPCIFSLQKVWNNVTATLHTSVLSNIHVSSQQPWSNVMLESMTFNLKDTICNSQQQKQHWTLDILLTLFNFIFSLHSTLLRLIAMLNWKKAALFDEHGGPEQPSCKRAKIQQTKDSWKRPELENDEWESIEKDCVQHTKRAVLLEEGHLRWDGMSKCHFMENCCAGWWWPVQCSFHFSVWYDAQRNRNHGRCEHHDFFAEHFTTGRQGICIFWKWPWQKTCGQCPQILSMQRELQKKP